MSMKKLSKKLLAVVAAGAMTMGLAMPVFADGTTTPDNKNNAKKAYVSKTYQTEVPHYFIIFVPYLNYSFDFNLLFLSILVSLTLFENIEVVVLKTLRMLHLKSYLLLLLM